MIHVVHVVPFLAVSAILVITPGIDMALVTKNALLHGRAAAQATALGINVGIFVWTIAAAAGLAAVIAASTTAFTAIKLVGACYLVVIGVRALLASRRTVSSPSARSAAGCCGRRFSTGRREQPAQSEDRCLLHEPPAARRPPCVRASRLTA